MANTSGRFQIHTVTEYVGDCQWCDYSVTSNSSWLATEEVSEHWESAHGVEDRYQNAGD